MVARAARGRRVPVTAIGIRGVTSPELEPEVDSMLWVKFGQFDDVIQKLHRAGVSRLILAGRVKHNSIFQLARMDARGRRLIARVATRKADSILGAVTQEFASENIEVLDSTIFLRGCMPGPGTLTPGVEISQKVREDISFGLEHAREIARLDIGQTVVVKDRSVVAVEAMEGTDRTIERAGEIAGAGIVAVKAPKPNQDPRFDVPVLGRTTVEKLVTARAAALAFPAGQILFLDQTEALERAALHGIAIVAI
jgi:hypothetical protein